MTDKAEDTFRVLKAALTSSPMLQNLEFGHTFLVHTDASKTSLGELLPQDVDGEEHLVIYIR